MLALCLGSMGSPGALAQSERGPDGISRINSAGTTSLSGQWRFQQGDDLRWASPEFDDSGWRFRSVPGNWPTGGFPETDQYAWYRLTLHLDAELVDEGEPLGVRLGKVHSAYELYANGQQVGQVGRLPPLAQIDYDLMKVFPLHGLNPGPDGRLVLALRVWGGAPAEVKEWGGGPFTGTFSVGPYSDLLRQKTLSELPGLLLATIIFAFGLYHLYLYQRNPRLSAYGWFGLLALGLAIYCLNLTQWKHQVGLSFLAVEKIEFWIVYLLPALTIQAIWALLDRKIEIPLRLYQGVFVAFSLAVVAIPGWRVMFNTLGIFHLLTMPLLVYIPWVVCASAHRGNKQARVLVFGICFFAAASLNDILIDMAGTGSVRLAPLGFFAILVSMVASLANRFSSMLDSLESEVVARTGELERANAQLSTMALQDPLTGALNRRGFAEQVEMEIRRVRRTGRAFTLILADVDNFKRFNDDYGHAAGDHVLSCVAGLLESQLREIDCVGRWGGEEFVLLLPETNEEGANALAEKLRGSIADNVFEFRGDLLQVTMTFGVAVREGEESLERCLARADKALYEGKRGGRNRVTLAGKASLRVVS